MPSWVDDKVVSRPLEVKIWPFFRSFFKRIGWMADRIETSTVCAFPDTIVVSPWGSTYYIELKVMPANLKPSYRPGQLARLQKLRKNKALSFVGTKVGNKYYVLPPKEVYQTEDFCEENELSRRFKRD